MRFDKSLRQRWSRTDDGWVFAMPDGWMQGRSVFGGLTVAAAAGLGCLQIDPTRRLRTVSAHLLRPVTRGPVQGSFRVLREGGSVTFAEVALAQDGLPVALAHLVFGRPRENALTVEPSEVFSAPGPDGLFELPFIEGVTPEFTQHVAMRWADGSPPFSGTDKPQFSGYCRFRVPIGDEEGMLGMLDAWPSPSLSMLREPAPASTVSWTAHLLHMPASFDDWFGFTYATVAGSHGFHTAVGHLFAPDGTLIGFTEQLVAVFA